MRFSAGAQDNAGRCLCLDWCLVPVFVVQPVTRGCLWPSTSAPSPPLDDGDQNIWLGPFCERGLEEVQEVYLQCGEAGGWGWYCRSVLVVRYQLPLSVFGMLWSENGEFCVCFELEMVVEVKTEAEEHINKSLSSRPPPSPHPLSPPKNTVKQSVALVAHSEQL